MKPKLILNCEYREMGAALNAIMETMPNYPNQKIGEKNAVEARVGDTTFAIIRNIDSYTARSKEILDE